VRLRPLTEAECYARCYGGVRSEQVSVVRPLQVPRERLVTERPKASLERHPRGEAA